MSNAYDLIILGGGCAGLSLAQALSNADSNKLRTLIIEQRSHYGNDRTWCFWKTNDIGDNKAQRHHEVDQQWQQMRVGSSAAHKRLTVTVDCAETPYQRLSSERFYTAALKQIAATQHIDIKLGSPVIDKPIKVAGLWTVETAQGVFSASAIVDTRPQTMPAMNGATLWQSFYGYDIECSDAIFDSQCIDLMDFLPTDNQDIPFVYVLPYSATQALIEITVFSPNPLSRSDLQVQLDAAIARRVGQSSFRCLRSESGILPMGLNTQSAAQEPSYVFAGVMAGSARASTGFAFQRIQQWAGKCAHALRTTGLPVAQPQDAKITQLMDGLFLTVLLQNPKQAGDLFYALFKRCNTARIIRFLSGTGSKVDAMAVVAALPPWLFIKALFSSTNRY